MVSGGLISFTSPAIVAVETEMQPKTDLSRLQTATSDLPVIFTVGKAVSAQSQFTTDLSSVISSHVQCMSFSRS